MEVEGGNQPVATYLTSEQIEAAGDAIADAGACLLGIVMGFFGLKKLTL